MTNVKQAIITSDVIEKSLGVIRRNPVPIFGISLAIVGMSQLLLGFVTLGAIDAGSGAAAVVGGLNMFVMAFCTLIVQAALIVACTNDLAGKSVHTGVCIKNAVSNLLPLIGLGILANGGILLGTALLIVPGMILLTMWMVAVPVLIVEQATVIQALQRSAQLTKGTRLKLLGLVALFMLATYAIGLVAGLMTLLAPLLSLVLTAMLQAISSAFGAVGLSVIYIELRTAKEGTSSDQLASVFA